VPLADIGSIVSSYDPSSWYDAALAALDARYPSGSWIVRGADDSEQTFGQFLSSKGSFSDLVSSMGFAIHEVAHTFSQKAGSGRFQYMVGKDTTQAEDISVVGEIETFPRKEIRELIPSEMASLTYVSTYLEGGSGEMDIESTLDEFNAYTHHLYADYAFQDQQPDGSRRSSRDGMVSFMLFLEMYLQVGRTEHPNDYAALKASPEFHPLILKFWDRAMCLYKLTKDIPGLGMDDDKVAPHMLAAEWLAEIDSFRN
jgi:hypothetical protein